MLVFLSKELAGKIDLDLFLVFTVSSVSVVWEALYLSNSLYLSNDIPLFDSLLMDLSFLLLDACSLSFLFTASILFFSMVLVMDLFTTLYFFNVVNPFFNNFLCSSDQWVFGIHDLGTWYFLPGFLQNEVNFTKTFQLVYSLFQQQSIKRNEIPVIQSFSFKYCLVTQTWSN